MWFIRLVLSIVAVFNPKLKKLLTGERDSLRVLAERVQRGDSHIWVHASSVGEFEQARPLIERLRQECPEKKIVLTFFSPSGYEMRKDYPLADVVVYLPFATKKNAQRFLDIVQPERAIFIKYEFWPAYLRELKSRGIPTYSIASIFRPSQLFFKPWGGWYRKLLHCFTCLCVQDDASRELLAKYGIENVLVAGDSRFDRVAAIMQTSKDLPLIKSFAQSAEQIIVAGSTWQEDEVLLAKYLEHNPTVKLVLVPHEIHAAHLHSIFQLFKGRYMQYSILAKHAEIQMPMFADQRVLVVDTMGLLSSIYRYANVAYIGGGFGAGIHNTLEAAVYGIPVVFGPNYKRFREARGLIQVGGGFSIKNQKELNNVFDHCLDNAQNIGAQADAYVRSEQGATEQLLKQIMR